LMSVEEGKNFSRFSPEVINLFQKHSWQGNVRELQNVIRNIVVLNTGEEVTMQMVPPPMTGGAGAEIAHSVQLTAEPQKNVDIRDGVSHNHSVDKTQIEPLWIVEKRAIQAAIDACEGNIPRAAGLLEVSPSTIYRKLQAWQEAAGSNREIK